MYDPEEEIACGYSPWENILLLYEGERSLIIHMSQVIFVSQYIISKMLPSIQVKATKTVSRGTKVAYRAKTHIFCTRKVYSWNFVYW